MTGQQITEPGVRYILLALDRDHSPNGACDPMSDIVNGLGRAGAYSALGLVLLVLGIFLVDMLTPGKLGRQIWQERNRNAALVLSSALLGIGGIVFTSIWTTYEDFGRAWPPRRCSACWGWS